MVGSTVVGETALRWSDDMADEQLREDSAECSALEDPIYRICTVQPHSTVLLFHSKVNRLAKCTYYVFILSCAEIPADCVHTAGAVLPDQPARRREAQRGR